MTNYDPSLQRCANCGGTTSQCLCTEDDMNRWAAEEIASWEGYDPNCFFCGGTGLAPNGWDDCPECTGYVDEDAS